MVAPWTVEEMAGVDLNDQRLNKRLTRILSDLGDRPTASIPAEACPDTSCVCVADSASDIYELFAECGVWRCM